MTLRLSHLFEMHITTIIANWKSFMRKSGKKANKRKPRKKGRRVPNGVHNSSDDDDDDDFDDAGDDSDSPKRPKGRPPKKSSQGSGSNTVTSSVNHEPMPGTSGRRTRPVRSRRLISEEEEENRSKSDSGSLSSGTSSSSDDDSDDSNGIPLASLGDGSKLRSGQTRRGRLYDSGDSYKPNGVKKPKRKRGRPQKSESLSPIKAPKERKKRKRFGRSSDDDDQTATQNGSISKKRARTGGNTTTENSHFTRSSQHVSTQSDDNHSSESEFLGNMRSRRNRRFESDQSYHQEQTSNVRRPIVESDTENENTIRPTRGSVKRAQLNWGRGTDSPEENNEGEDASASRNTNSTNVSTYCNNFFMIIN